MPILEHLDLAGRFKAICGDTLDGRRGSKALVIGDALRRLADPDPSSVVMVGDRSHDVIGAGAHGLRSYGAGWGYGAADELTVAGAAAVYASPADLHRELDRLVKDSGD